MTAESVATVTKPADVGLKREMGLIGATWASETSIIGSGWLFGAFGAAQFAGPAALIGWILGGIAVIILALVHAELGAMYPVAGGTARFPHFAFGSVAGISFGFFSWHAGHHRRTDRVLRGDAVQLVLLAEPVRPD